MFRLISIIRPIVAIVSALESTRIPIVSMEFRLFLWEIKRGNILSENSLKQSEIFRRDVESNGVINETGVENMLFNSTCI